VLSLLRPKILNDLELKVVKALAGDNKLLIIVVIIVIAVFHD